MSKDTKINTMNTIISNHIESIREMYTKLYNTSDINHRKYLYEKIEETKDYVERLELY